ncbi:MAG TPA: hypothetical protein QF753_22785 [Victivallales bacterium]|nr:hypothetical protein [Victivallales bacterium]
MTQFGPHFVPNWLPYSDSDILISGSSNDVDRIGKGGSGSATCSVSGTGKTTSDGAALGNVSALGALHVAVCVTVCILLSICALSLEDLDVCMLCILTLLPLDMARLLLDCNKLTAVLSLLYTCSTI